MLHTYIISIFIGELSLVKIYNLWRKMMADITAFILTRNEELNIVQCIDSFKHIVSRIVVMDNFSSDNTASIAKRLGADVYESELGYFERFQYGLENTDIHSKWVLFIDADERVTPEAANELEEKCNKYADSDVNGIVVRYNVFFMGKEIKHGGIYPSKKLRVFKPGTAYMEDIKLDQHILLKSGKLIEMKYDLLHYDYKGLSHWINKHNTYADWASEDFLLKESGEQHVVTDGLEKSAKIKRILKYKVYYKLPMGMRAYLFYVYRYYIRLGFLDGKEGKIYAFLHAYWYRFLVDAKIYEQKKVKSK